VEPIVQDGWATYVAPDILECLRKASAEGPTSLFDPPPLCCMHGLRAGTVGKLRRVKERILKLSDGTEILLVLLIAFGMFLPSNLAALVSPDLLAHRDSPPISNSHLQGLVLYEVVILVVLAVFLRARGWTLVRLGVQPTVRDTVYGVGLCMGYYLFYWVLVMALATVWPTFARLSMSTHLVAADLHWPTVVMASTVNPVFEEVLVCGYVITALKGRVGTTTAVNVSVGIRVFYHLYQGAVGVVGIAPLALLFAYGYARTGRLWPLIVAHALTDFWALAASL
jgi:membrane protease YdiL (CAAX protease family)